MENVHTNDPFDVIRELRLEISSLRAKVKCLEDRHPLNKGLSGEEYVAATIGGKLTTSTQAPYDVNGPRGDRIEVKLSKLLNPSEPRPSTTRRWGWNNLLGHSGKRRYDNLILLGEPDSRFSYWDQGPYVIFDVPFGDVEREVARRGRWAFHLTLNANPELKQSMGWDFLHRHRTTMAELRQRYGA